MAAVSMAASSGRQRIATSTCASNSRLAWGSLRRSGAMLTISMAGMAASLSRMPSPVVPASPSMKTFAIALLLVLVFR
jgi:hypothetical protein